MRPSSHTHDARGLFLSTMMKSPVHLSLQYQEILAAYTDTNFEELKTLFEETLRLILEQSFEILNVSTVINTFTLWVRSNLCQFPVFNSEKNVHISHRDDHDFKTTPTKRLALCGHITLDVTARCWFTPAPQRREAEGSLKRHKRLQAANKTHTLTW